MNVKEHLQLLAMMIPTLLLLAAVVASLAFPVQSAEAPSAGVVLAASVIDAEVDIIQDIDTGPASSTPAR